MWEESQNKEALGIGWDFCFTLVVQFIYCLLLPYIYNEPELLRRVAGGSAEAFEIIYKRYYFSVFLYARHFVKDVAAAEDIATETFLKFWSKRQEFEGSERLRSFFFVATKHACLNYLRGEERALRRADEQRRLVEGGEEDFEVHEVREQMYEYLYEEINRLPERMKGVLRLQLEGLSNSEIGVRMGISEKTVRNLKVEGLKMLRVVVLRNGLMGLFIFFEVFGTN